MSSTVSKSPNPDDHVLSRHERDDSYSTGAGRKAIEQPKPDRPKADRGEGRKECGLQPSISFDETKGAIDEKSP